VDVLAGQAGQRQAKGSGHGDPPVIWVFFL